MEAVAEEVEVDILFFGCHQPHLPEFPDFPLFVFAILCDRSLFPEL